jgi:hypothetical protein
MFPQCIACIILLIEMTLAAVMAYLSYKDLKHEEQ